MNLHSDAPGAPCPNMEGLLNRAADGSSKGFVRWYTLAHAVRCTHCRRYLEALEAMIDSLRKQRGTLPSPETQSRLEGIVAAAGAQIDP